MPVTENYNRPKSAVVNSTPIDMRLKVAEKSATPVLLAPTLYEAARAIILHSNGYAALHDTLTVGADVFEILDGASGSAADRSVTTDSNIPVSLSEDGAALSDITASLNGTRSDWTGHGYLKHDGVTALPFKSPAENHIKAQYWEDGSGNGVLVLTDADAPNGVHNKSGRSLTVTGGNPSFNILDSTFGGAEPVVKNPLTQAVAGTTGALDCIIQADGDPTGGTDWQDLWHIEATPDLDVNGVSTLTPLITPILGNGSAGTPITFTPLVHPQNMDAWQTAAGDARQA